MITQKERQMKKIFNMKSLLLSAVAVMGLTACSDSDSGQSPDELVQEQNTAIEALVAEYTNDVVYDTYGKLAAKSEALYNAINAVKQKLTAATPETVTKDEIGAICTLYKEARAEWEESEAFLFGAADEYDIDPHIDTWPLDVEVLAADLADDNKIAALNSENGIEWARATGNLTPENLGFHGLEFIFFRDGKNRDEAIFNNNAIEDYVDAEGNKFFEGKNVTGKEEIIFAAAIAGDLRDKCYQLEVCWMGEAKAPAAHVARIKACIAAGDDSFGLFKEGTNLSYGDNLNRAAGTTYNSWKKSLEQIFDGCNDICSEVADLKMGQAYRVSTDPSHATHEEEDEDTGETIIVKDDVNYIESPYSHNSFTDFKGNIQSIKNSLYGGRSLTTPTEKSIMAYLEKYNPELAADVDAKLNAALNALDACLKSGKSFVEAPGAPVVGTAIEAISDLDSQISEAKSWVLAN